MKTQLDWSAYAHYGEGDAYADIPAQGGDFARAVAVCIGNRQCQRNERGVMCPSFRVTGEALHSTRERIVALKAVLNGAHVDFTDPRLWAALELCVACKGCKRECPNGVDMAALRIEALAQRHVLRGTPWRTRLFARLPRLLHRVPVLRQGLVLRNRLGVLRALGERWPGIAAQRDLPVPVPVPFHPPLEGTGPEGAREVVLWVDTWTRYFEPRIAEAALGVLRAGGYRVLWVEAAADDAEPTRPVCCGRAYLSAGLVDEARHEAQRVLAALMPHVEAGRPIIGLEPSCLLSLRDEYRQLGLGEAVPRLAKAAVLFEEFLAAEQTAGRLKLPFKPMMGRTVHVHGHCHQKAFGAMKALRKTLGLVPGLSVDLIEASCCGMAGSFGYEAEHHALSLDMAEQALLPAVRATPETDTVLADGFSCRHQIRDGSGREARHVAELLFEALVPLSDPVAHEENIHATS